MNLRLLALRTTIVLLIVLVALVLWQMREAAQLLGLAIVIAAALAPLLNRMVARGWHRSRAAGVVFGSGVLLAIAAVAIFGTLAVQELGQITDRMPLWYSNLQQNLEARGGWARDVAALLPSSATISDTLLGDEAQVGSTLLDALLHFGGLVALVVGSASLGFYWMLDEQRITRLWLSLLPLRARSRARAIWDGVGHELGIYARGVVVTILLTTLTLLGLYTLLGVPGAALLAIAGGLAQVIPLLGPALAVLPGTLAGLARSEVTALLAFVSACGVMLVVRLVVVPRAFRGGIKVNPVLVVVLIMALAELVGLPLIVLAPPLAAAIQAVTQALLNVERSQAAQSRVDRIEELEERLEDAAAHIDVASPDSQRLQGLVERARRLLAEAQQA